MEEPETSMENSTGNSEPVKPILEESPEDARAFLAVFGLDSTKLTDAQVTNRARLIRESLSKPSSEKETSVDLAYKISIDYFESSIKRFDAVDTKIQNLFTFAIGIFAITPILIKSKAETPLVAPFWIGIVLLILSGLISICARVYGKLIILNPKLLYEEGLGMEPEVFKQSVINTAADAYEKNSETIEFKHKLNVLSMFVFGTALAFLIY